MLIVEHSIRYVAVILSRKLWNFLNGINEISGDYHFSFLFFTDWVGEALSTNFFMNHQIFNFSKIFEKAFPQLLKAIIFYSSIFTGVIFWHALLLPKRFIYGISWYVGFCIVTESFLFDWASGPAIKSIIPSKQTGQIIAPLTSFSMGTWQLLQSHFLNLME